MQARRVDGPIALDRAQFLCPVADRADRDLNRIEPGVLGPGGRLPRPGGDEQPLMGKCDRAELVLGDPAAHQPLPPRARVGGRDRGDGATDQGDGVAELVRGVQRPIELTAGPFAVAAAIASFTAATTTAVQREQ